MSIRDEIAEEYCYFKYATHIQDDIEKECYLFADVILAKIQDLTNIK